MKPLLSLCFLLLLGLFAAPAAQANDTNLAIVVPTCGAQTYSPGFPAAQTQDTTGRNCDSSTAVIAPAAQTSVALDASTVTTLNVAVVALTSPHHAKGGWLKNCNATGTLYVNDNGTATTTEGGSNAALAPGLGGNAQAYFVAPGTQTISVTGSANGMAICGEGFN